MRWSHWKQFMMLPKPPVTRHQPFRSIWPITDTSVKLPAKNWTGDGGSWLPLQWFSPIVKRGGILTSGHHGSLPWPALFSGTRPIDYERFSSAATRSDHLPTNYDTGLEQLYLDRLEHQLIGQLIITSHALPLEQIVNYQKFAPIVVCERSAHLPIRSVYNDRLGTFKQLFGKSRQQDKLILGWFLPDQRHKVVRLKKC